MQGHSQFAYTVYTIGIKHKKNKKTIGDILDQRAVKPTQNHALKSELYLTTSIY